MKFFQKYFNKHHLLHQPHKWFLAILISPLQAAEMHYKRKYHLQFAHAKKLFFFDISLLLSILILIGATIFWLTYNPTITDLINLSITSSSERIKSGEQVTFTINYQNESTVRILESNIIINLPPGFVLDKVYKVYPEDIFSAPSQSFNLGTLAPGSNGSLSINGWLYATPNEEERIIARMSYKQETRNILEEKSRAIIITLRDSVLKTEIESSEKILSHGSVPLTITLKNDGEKTLNNLEIPLTLTNGLSLIEPKPSLGTINQTRWWIEKLAPQQEENLQAILNSSIDTEAPTIALEIIPAITVNNQKIPQTTKRHEFLVVRPQVTMTAWWEGNPDSTQPWKTNLLHISLINQGNTKLSDLIINLPIPASIIDINSLLNLNSGTLKQGELIISKQHKANLAELDPGDNTEISLDIPIAYSPSGGTDLKLSLSPRLKAKVSGIPDSIYEISSHTPTIKIGTQLFLDAEIRYYTNEGDQLGRGPLPPKVGKETKYWAIINLRNTTSQVADLNFSAQLPAYVVWTGRSSVSHGSDVKFDPQTRIISWQTNSLSPDDKAGIFFELSLTPTKNQRNTTPILIEQIQISAFDNYINEPITRTSPILNSSLPNDLIARQSGVNIQ